MRPLPPLRHKRFENELYNVLSDLSERGFLVESLVRYLGLKNSKGCTDALEALVAAGKIDCITVYGGGRARKLYGMGLNRVSRRARGLD